MNTNEQSQEYDLEFTEEIDTQIDSIKKLFDANKIFSSNRGDHYIVKDSADEIYYLKVNKFTNQSEYEYCLSFYQRLEKFINETDKIAESVIKILNVKLTRSKHSKAMDIMKS